MLRNRLSYLTASLLLLSATAFSQQAPPTTPPAGTDVLTVQLKEEILGQIEEIVTKRAFVPGVDLAKWPEFLEKQREAIDKAERETEFTRAVNSALRDFGISHIRFLAPRAAQARVRTSVVGVGLNARPGEGGMTVTMVFPKSPADEAGIKQGDLIIQIDGKAADDSAALNGEEGTEITVKVKAADGAEKDIKLVRKPYSVVREDTLTWIGDDTAVLKIHSFSRGYERAVIEKHMTDAAKAKYLILDLRSNGGGATTNLQHLLSMLLPPDTVIGTFVSRRVSDQYKEKHGKEEADPIILANDTTNKYRTRKGKVEPFAGKIAVLTNRGSASASEIAACALKEHANAQIIGSRTAGAVLASVFGKLAYGYEIQYPMMDYVSFKGVRLEKNPVMPDVEVTVQIQQGKPDPAIEVALEKFRASK